MFAYTQKLKKENDGKVKINIKKIALQVIAALFVCTAVVLYYHSVDNSLTEEDKFYIQKYLSNINSLSKNSKYTDEIDFITSVQRSVLKSSPGDDGLPFGQKRGPKELYDSKAGLCYDRSRVIEKILRYAGFKTRHVFILSKVKTGSTIKSLVTPGVSSHAVSEVLTKNGWLVVDSNAPWISIDANNRPISILEIKSNAENSILIDWYEEPPTPIYINVFTSVYGLYSRHGKFYPPYNPIPDIEYGEFIQNIL